MLPVCTAAITNCYTYSPPCTASLTTDCNLPCSATVTANCFAQPCSSTVTSLLLHHYPPCSATVTTNCNAVGERWRPERARLPCQPRRTRRRIHYLTFTYSGDLTEGEDFACSVNGGAATASCPSTGATAFPLVVDFADFNITSTTILVDVNPGVVPSGNGLPSAPGQSSSVPETGTLQLQALLSFAGGGSNAGAGISPMVVTCSSSHPSYISCFMTPTTTCLTSTSGNCLPAQTGTVTTSTVVLAVSTPVSLPLGFNTSEVRTVATRTALAFLPFGLLAFCVRRRRRLSQVLWMLIAICAVSAGMIGCSGDQTSRLFTRRFPQERRISWST